MSLVCAGDNVVDVYRGTGQAYPGGNALNVSVAARRSGVPSAYLGAVGEDEAGRRLIAALTAEAVATDRLRVLPGSTAWCGVQVVDGDRQFLDADFGVSMFDLSADDLTYIAGFDALHTGDNSGLEAQLADIAAATKVSFDFGSRPWSYVDELIDLNKEEPADEHILYLRLATEGRMYAVTIPPDTWISVNTTKELEQAQKLVDSGVLPRR